jgi:catechol 2,3-dioxygenase-like lactoylglutathione lyase family enzyme
VPEEIRPRTVGIDHVGLAVRDLVLSQSFFCDCLGWSIVGGLPAYPASFVSDGHTVLTLWQVKDPERATAFDRHQNIGLHHLALRVESLQRLEALYSHLRHWPGVTIEFAPEQSAKGPKVHFMIREPSGVRVEFTYDPRR